jgi:hypothetical protein
MLDYQLPKLTLWTQFDAAQITDALAEIHAAKIKLDVDTTHAVAQARKLGLSWDAIGDQLNVSRQAAWERWHHLDP